MSEELDRITPVIGSAIFYAVSCCLFTKLVEHPKAKTATKGEYFDYYG